MRFILIPAFVISFLFSLAQDENFRSIHQEQSDYYRSFGSPSSSFFDSVNGFLPIENKINATATLQKRVFGYFPYWAGNNYINYQWNLLSDLCYFSYEVDPATGEPVTTYEWSTSPAIDSAFANGVRVHLCVTLFSGHSTFFNSPSAQQTLISNIISLVQSRGAHGVNMDVEALPSSLGGALTEFMVDLTSQVHSAIPGSEVSIASPAVNWSNTFNIAVLAQHVDFFMVMAYDYYWNGSAQAGPVAPTYSMAGNYDYNFSKTISYYQYKGVSADKLIIGVPYYGRQWPTNGQYAPSATTGSGTAYTYRYIKTNASGNYSDDNRLFEPNSLSTYYAWQSGGWTQCFVDEVYSLEKKYDVVNLRNLAGIGIWALGYDDGYDDLWNVISDKFSSEATVANSDTIYDSGGPAFNYYNDEKYLYTITVPEQKTIQLSFEYFDLEPGYDSLWIYDGADTTALLIGGYSGNDNPGSISSSSGHLTLRFLSDVGITGQGWKAVYQVYPASVINEGSGSGEKDMITVYPNPFETITQICYEIARPSVVKISIYDFTGNEIVSISEGRREAGWNCTQFLAAELPSGIYFCSLEQDGMKSALIKMIMVR